MPKKKDRKIGFSWNKNANNGFAAVKLHYTADPAKRSKEWKKKASFGMDHKAWQTEMELSWETYAGEPVYGREFTVRTHVFEERVEPDADYPFLIRGWDFGGNHSCVVTQYIHGRVVVLDEFPNVGYNTRRIAREIQEECNRRYGPDFHYLEAIDPSGAWEGKTSTGLACKDIMVNELNMKVVPGVQDPTRRIDAVMKFLVTMQDAQPTLMLNPGLPMLTQGFLGGYHYPEKLTKNQKINRPEKNEYSHIHDALQYACTVIKAQNYNYMGEIDISSLDGLNYDL